MAIVLNEDWTVYVVGEMHKYRIKGPELAEECGYHHTYLSTILNNNKEFGSEEAARRTRDHVLDALERVKARRIEEVKENDAEQGED